MSWDLGLSGCRVLVTGGTKGVGRAVVESFAGLGANVLTTARSQPPALPAGAQFVMADLNTAEGCSLLSREVTALMGGVDVIVHVVGGSDAPLFIQRRLLFACRLLQARFAHHDCNHFILDEIF